MQAEDMAPTFVAVNDPGDPRLVEFTHLTDAQLREQRERGASAPGHGMFIVEGHLALGSLVVSPFPVRSLLVSTAQVQRVRATVAELPPSVTVFVAEPEVVNATVGFRLHRGVVASAARLAPRDPAEVAKGAQRILVIEGVNDHENLGGLFRNAAAFGVGAVLLDPRCADPLYRRSVRVSLGHVLRVPFATVESWPDGLVNLAERLGVATVALTPEPAAPTIADVARDLRARPARAVALMVGAEGPGLTAQSRGAAFTEARIPMAPGVDSLNVATAAAVALHALA